MAGYTPDELHQVDPRALGKAVQKLRLAKRPRLTQVRLGEAAGYATGAGISISRIENGQMKPSPERFEKIAQSLGVTPTALLQATLATMEQLKRGPATDSIEERLAKIRRFEEMRARLVDDLEAFDRASEHANEAFLVRFRNVVARVDGTPPPDPDHLARQIREDADPRAEAAYQLQLTTFGVEKALSRAARSQGGVGAPDSTALTAFAEAVSRESLRLGAVVPSTVPLIAFPRAIGLTGVAGGVVALVVSGAITIGWQLSRSKRTARAENQLAAELADVEGGIERTRPGLLALRESILRATQILEYVAVHAAHALSRWEVQIGEGRRDWESLIATGEENRYFEFAEIAAAQLAVVTLGYDDLLKTRGDELERTRALIDDVLSQARGVIESHV